MTVKVEKIEENKVKLTVTLSEEQFNKALDEAFKKVVKEVNVQGFRKGKVPRKMFEQRFGVESLYEEAINYLLPNAYPEAVEEAKIEPVAQPEIDVDFENIGKDKPLTFFATVVVKPDVKLGQYKGLEVEEISKDVTEEDIDAEINKLLEQNAELVIKETEAVLGDTVVIDYEGFKDDVAFEGGKAENHSLVLGSNSFIPGFEEQLVGIKPGQSKSINVKFPEEYQSEELKGADAKFNVVCHEVKTRELPELNEDFVKELNRENINTLEELKTDIKTNLINQKETAAKNHLVDQVVEKAATNAEITIPQEMIDAEADKMLHDTSHRLEQQGINLELYLQYTGSTKEGLLEQFKGEAVKRIRYSLTLEQITKEEDFAVTEEDINKEFEQISKMYNISVEQVKEAIPNTSEMEQEIKSRKAVDFLVENSVKL